MKVQATDVGFYCNVRIEVGWVFELLRNADGSDPVREEWVPKLVDGKDTGDGEYVTWIDPKTKRPVHRDFAPDSGDFMVRQGPKRGEVARFGWMKQVPDETPDTMFGELSLTDLLYESQHGFDVNTRKMRRAPAAKRPDPPLQTSQVTPKRAAG